MTRHTHINMPIPEHMSAGIKYLIEQGEFATQAEYVRHLIRTDLPRRLAAREHDRLVLERLEQAKRGGPFVRHEDAMAYIEARARGENPPTPPTFTRS